MMKDQSHFEIRVFLVDDQAIVGAQVRRMLADQDDITFHYCQNPASAIAEAREFKPTVILQDLVMPDIDGMTMVRFFKGHAELKEIPLIVLSSKEEPRTKADAFSLGANDYLVKLPDQLELLARIRYHSHGYITLLERNEAYEALKASQEELAEELSMAADYVVSILPQPIAEERGIHTEWTFIPSARLGGDSFGYHWIDEDHFAIYLLDVCDHGVGPALLSVSAINVLRSQTLPEVDFRVPDAVLSAMNNTFQMEDNNNLYFTLWYGVYRPSDRKLSYSSGGHPPALLVSDTQTQELSTPGMIVGGMPDMPYRSGAVIVEPGSELVVYSDGVYEISIPDRTMWSFDEFKTYMETHVKNAEWGIDELHRLVVKLHGDAVLEDDFSMMRLRFL